MPEATASRKCADCADNDGIHEIRKRHLCSACFKRYICSKILKRMESFRLKHQTGSTKPRLLLPLSGGVSSLVLLSTLDAQLQKQTLKQNRTAYELVVTHIDTSPTPSSTPPAWYTSAAEQFRTHSFLPPTHISSIIAQSPTLPTALASLNLPSTPPSTPPLTTYHTLLQACTTPTSLNDVTSTLLTRTLVHLAHTNACSSILLSHSDTRLAALSLSLVASGRGAAVPGVVADAFHRAHGVSFNHPCRDLFKAELQLYAGLLEAELPMAEGERRAGTTEEEGKAPKPPPSIRSVAIEELLTGYMTAQAVRYPSIMANVVRTAGKLQSEQPREGDEDEGGEGEGRYCVFCRGLMVARTGGEGVEDLCYGCVRMRQDIKAG